ncbi:MAG TPA: efflux RND transporter periplasmic adaptor subunit [Tenuifilaceae bacterium]|nr:efflux RND transporter periplasmic adaptor subunit [Tenuifilaceae bacterium]
MKNNHFFIGGLILLFLFTSCSKNAKQNRLQEPKSYKTEVLEPQKIELQSVFPAVLKGQEDIEIKPRIDGFIEAVYVDEGAKVKKGQSLFKINSPSSVKAIEEAKASYNTAKLNVERMRPLAEKNIISKVQLEAYQNSLDAAKATLEQAQSTLGWTNVTSPVDGVVGTISYRLGSLVNSSSVLTTVSSTAKIFAYFSMNEKELYNFMDKWEGQTKVEKIKNIPDVKFLLSNGTEYNETGRIATISGVVDQTTGSVNFRASFPNSKGLLLSGSSGKVIIPQYIEKALVIPQKATFSQQDKTMIYKVEGDSVVQKIIEVKSTPDGKSYVITNGLSAGDRVVADDIINLSNGEKIKLQ